jgi:heterodisulfide reductase subunit B
LGEPGIEQGGKEMEETTSTITPSNHPEQNPGDSNKVALFLGCVIPTEQYAYELSLRQIMPELDVQLVDLEGFSCCGAPLRSINLNLSRYLSIRNLAICSMDGLDVLAPCPLCHLALTEANNLLCSQECAEDKEQYLSMLAEEGLEFNNDVKIYHTIDLLTDLVGLDKIRDKTVKPLNDIEFASHYGCHLIRPTLSTRPDAAEKPEKMDEILKVIGASTKDYPEKLNCCGGPLLLNLPDSALTKTGQKLQAVQNHGFNALVDTCPWGHRLFDSRQKNAADTIGEKLDMPVFYLTQLIGLALGKEPDTLGLNLNLSPINKIESLGIYQSAGTAEAKEEPKPSGEPPESGEEAQEPPEPKLDTTDTASGGA